MIMPNKVYDTLKWVATIAMPAAGTLYFALAETWGLPKGAEVVATLAALEAFAGALLQISSAKYNAASKA